jgi:hypothetical protein
LRRIIDDEVVPVPRRDAAVGLRRVMGLEAGPVRALDDDVGLGEAFIDVAPAVIVEGFDVGLAVADLGSARVAGLFPIDDRRRSCIRP